MKMCHHTLIQWSWRWGWRETLLRKDRNSFLNKVCHYPTTHLMNSKSTRKAFVFLSTGPHLHNIIRLQELRMLSMLFIMNSGSRFWPCLYFPWKTSCHQKIPACLSGNEDVATQRRTFLMNWNWVVLNIFWECHTSKNTFVFFKIKTWKL